MKDKKLIDELLAALKESHQEEIDNKHYGDKTCSYCDLIAKAEEK